MTLEEARAQLHHAKTAGLYESLHAAAATHALPFAFVLAGASRETNLRNILGDGAHGIGVLQIDIRYHPEARHAKAEGSWQTHPGVLIDVGCRILAENLRWAKSLPQGQDEHAALKISASAYNAGQGGARAGIQSGDCDRRTTGRNYGKDTLERMKLFEELLAGTK